MVFSSAIFLFYFLPIVILGYFASPRLFRNSLLVLVSLAFYFWGAGAFYAAPVVLRGGELRLGLLLGAVKDATPRRLILACGIILNLSILGYFKYRNFFVLQINGVGQQLEWGVIAWQNVILPIGISFYTFTR
jgi:alginate O-acetyltransferase complex protein AlgI